MFIKRILSGGIILVFSIIILGFSEVPFLLNITIGVLSAMAVYEALVTTKYIESKAMMFISLFLAFIMPVVPELINVLKIDGFTIGRVTTFGIFAFAMVVFIFMIIFYGKFSFEHIAVVFLLTVIISFFFTTLIYVRMIPLYGLYYIYFVFIGAWGSDTFCYGCGRFFGKHKLVEKISPKKTIEGSVGGLILTSVFFGLGALILNKCFHLEVNYILFIVTGIFASAVGQIGDLSASIIKRNFAVKDFGSLIPGHGGILDRFDSVIFVSPALYILFSNFTYIK
ncbi:MAG: phosphatidate cytidylyltransferase [Clostridia bacterium]